jgi:hypothetical protein
MQLRENYLNAGKAGFWLDINWNTASGIANFNARVFVQDDFNRTAVPAKSFIDAVIYDFPKAVHEAAGVGGADVHSGAFANRL